jgi:hypothetical protein
MRKKYLFILLSLATIVIAATGTVTWSTDSTTPQKPAMITPYYPSQMTTTPGTVTDTNNTSYPPCPGDPSTPSSPSQPICPDINGRWPANISFNPNDTYPSNSLYTNSQAYCPDVCRATRFATPTVPQNFAYPVLVTNYQIATCPAGYAQMFANNLQPAITVITSTSPPLDFPIDSMTKYTEYVNAGYDCSASQYVTSYSYCTTAGTSNQSQQDYYVPYPQTFNFVGNSKQTAITLINGYVGFYKDMTNFNYCYYAVPSDCSSQVPSANGCPWPSSAYLRKYQYDAYQVKCNRQPGNYYSTTDYIPVSIICSRVKSEFKSDN